MNNQNKALTAIMMVISIIVVGKVAYKTGVQDGRSTIINKALRPDGVNVTNNKVVQERINIRATPKKD